MSNDDDRYSLPPEASQRLPVNELGSLLNVEPIVAQLLRSYFWLSTVQPNTRYKRLQDDHDGEFRGWLSITFGEDGDAWLSLDKEDARFRMPGHGGGRSQHTRTALHILAEAIRLDNEESPQPLRQPSTKPAARDVCGEHVDEWQANCSACQSAKAARVATETNAPLCGCPIDECLEQVGKRCKDDK